MNTTSNHFYQSDPWYINAGAHRTRRNLDTPCHGVAHEIDRSVTMRRLYPLALAVLPGQVSGMHVLDRLDAVRPFNGSVEADVFIPSDLATKSRSEFNFLIWERCAAHVGAISNFKNRLAIRPRDFTDLLT
jgi:hypothetical protein